MWLVGVLLILRSRLQAYRDDEAVKITISMITYIAVTIEIAVFLYRHSRILPSQAEHKLNRKSSLLTIRSRLQAYRDDDG